jgi:hypothetical protein
VPLSVRAAYAVNSPSLARPAQTEGPPYKDDERNFVGASKGKATPETFFGKAVSEFGPERMAWGSNFPASEQSLAELVKLAEDTLAFLPECDRAWIFSGTAKVLYPALAN